MPRKTKQYASSKATADWSGFVRCEFDSVSKGDFVRWSEDNSVDTSLTAIMDEVTEHSLKLSVSFSAEQGTFTASLSGGKESDTPFKGWTLTARSNTWERAIAALAFKHFNLLKGNWINGIAKEDDLGGDFVS